jgi:hypothetical protein
MAFLKFKPWRNPSHTASKASPSPDGANETNASTSNLSRTSTLVDSRRPERLEGTTEDAASTTKAREDELRREQQERAWREAERRRGGATGDRWRGGIGPPVMGQRGAGSG